MYDFAIIAEIAAILTVFMVAVTLGLVITINHISKKLEMMMPHSWNDDCLELRKYILEIQNQLIALKTVIDDDFLTLVEKTDRNDRTLVNTVNDRVTNLSADISLIMGDHKIEHDNLDKSIDIFTKSTSLAVNEIKEIRDDLQLLTSSLNDIQRQMEVKHDADVHDTNEEIR